MPHSFLVAKPDSPLPEQAPLAPTRQREGLSPASEGPSHPQLGLPEMRARDDGWEGGGVRSCQLPPLRLCGRPDTPPPLTAICPSLYPTSHPPPPLRFLSLQDPLPSSPVFLPLASPLVPDLPQSRLAQPSPRKRPTHHTEPGSRLTLALSSCLSVFPVDLRG